MKPNFLLPALLLAAIAAPAAASEETEGMVRMFFTAEDMATAMVEDAEDGRSALEHEFDAWVFGNIYDAAEVERRLGTALEPLIPDADIEHFRRLAEDGHDLRLAEAWRENPGADFDQILDDLPRRSRRAISAFIDDGAAERYLDALQSPTVTAEFFGYVVELYCRAARDEQPQRYGSLAEEYCAAEQMLELPAATAGPLPEASAGARAAMEVFNVVSLLRAGFREGVTESGTPEEQAELQRMFDTHMSDDELLRVVGAELDRRARAEDLAMFAQFVQTDAGRELVAAMHGKSADEMTTAADALPPATHRRIEAFFVDGAFIRVANVIGDPQMLQVGIDLGRRVICRAAPQMLADELPMLVAAGVCPPETLDAPRRARGEVGKSVTNKAGD